MTRFHWLIIHRYHPRQDPLQAEGCHRFAIGQFLSHELHQERFRVHTTGHNNNFDDYEKVLKITLLNKSVIESSDNKFVDLTLKDGSKGIMYSPCTLMDYASIYGKA